jgi:radical SAM superfamily enzyme YgiQ (UPF0313 family)
MKIQLIHPPNDPEYLGVTDKSKTHIPIGLEILAKAVENVHGDKYNIEIIDGNQYTIEEIVPLLNADIVGATSLFSNHRNFLKILEEAKNKDAITIGGGINATNDSKRIIQNRPFIDHILRGHPEDIFPYVIEGEAYNKNQIFHSKHDIVFDLSHSDHEKYDKNRYIPISLKRGCIKSEDDGRCSFCSIKDLESIMKKPFEQIEVLKQYGFHKLRETADDFDFNFFKTLYERNPSFFKDIQFEIYANPLQITNESIELMQKLNVTRIFVGLDSYNDNILKEAGKGFSVKDVDKALKLIDNNIKVNLAFMLGFPNETLETLESNYRFFEETKNKYQNIYFHVSRVLPLIGTKLYRKLINQGVEQKTDIVDYKFLFEKQIELFTNLNMSDVDKYYNRMINDAFGSFSY